MAVSILDPQQAQGHSFAAQFGVDRRPVRLGDHLRRSGRRWGKETPVERFFVQVSRERPGEPGGLGPLQVLAHRAVGDAAAAGDGPVAQAALPLQTQDFADLAHG